MQLQNALGRDDAVVLKVLDTLGAVTRRMRLEAVSDTLLQRDAQYLLNMLRDLLLRCLQGGGDIAGQAATVYLNILGSASEATLAVADAPAFVTSCIRRDTPHSILLSTAAELVTIHDLHTTVLPLLPELSQIQPPLAEVFTILGSVANRLEEQGALHCAKYVMEACVPRVEDVELLQESPVEYIRGDTKSTCRRAAGGLMLRLLKEDAPHREVVLGYALEPLARMSGSGELGQFAGALLVLSNIAKSGLAVQEVGAFFTTALLPKLQKCVPAGSDLEDLVAADALLFVGLFCRRHLPMENVPDAMEVIAKWLGSQSEGVKLSASCALEKLLPCSPQLTELQANAVATPLFNALLTSMEARIAQTASRLISRSVNVLNASTVLSALVQCVQQCCGAQSNIEPCTVHYLFEGLAYVLAAHPTLLQSDVINAMLSASLESSVVSRYALHVVSRGLLLLGDSAVPVLSQSDQLASLGDPRHDAAGVYDTYTVLASLNHAEALQRIAHTLLHEDIFQHREGLRLLNALSAFGNDVSQLKAAVLRCASLPAPRWAAKPLLHAVSDVACWHGKALCSNPTEWQQVSRVVFSGVLAKGANIALGALRFACECSELMGDADLVKLLQIAGENMGFGTEGEASSDASEGSFSDESDYDDDDDVTGGDGEGQGASACGAPPQPVVLAALCSLRFPPTPTTPSPESYLESITPGNTQLKARLSHLPPSPLLQKLISLM